MNWKQHMSFLSIESKKVALTINDVKTKYMHVIRRCHTDRIGKNVTMDSYNFEYVRQFKYLRALITSVNDISEEIKANIQSGNMC